MGEVALLVKRLGLTANAAQVECKASDFYRLATARLGPKALGMVRYTPYSFLYISDTFPGLATYFHLQYFESRPKFVRLQYVWISHVWRKCKMYKFLWFLLYKAENQKATFDVVCFSP